MQVVEDGRNWKYEIGAGERIFGLAPIDCVSSERRRVAQVLAPRRQYQQFPSAPPIQETPTRVPVAELRQFEEAALQRVAAKAE
jgi:hypothetical protein